MARAKRKGWTEDYTAAVIVTSLTPNRVKHRVVGPCFYCGDDLATTVDHMLPVIRGGTDEPRNLVSCCLSCNSLKHDMTTDEFLRMFPWGSNDRKAFEKRQIAPDYWAGYEAEMRELIALKRAG